MKLRMAAVGHMRTCKPARTRVNKGLEMSWRLETMERLRVKMRIQRRLNGIGRRSGRKKGFVR
jgi:hypothetical protein